MTTLSVENSLLSVRDLHTTFPIHAGILQRKVGVVNAVSGISFDLHRGETLGLVGESGSGKSTLARTIVGLERAASGEVSLSGSVLSHSQSREMRRRRRPLQVIFQDPSSSLNPRRTVGKIISEPWEIHRDAVPRAKWPQEVELLLQSVGLNADHATRFPHQLSGGQKQRVGIARALALNPELIVCDEAVSALDVSIQAQILNLLLDLQKERGLTYLFIAHDLSVVRHISTRIAVMYLGKVVEIGKTEELVRSPSHPYTQALLSAVPLLKPWESTARTTRVLDGDIPSPIDPPSGCRFRTRCWKAQQICADVEPKLIAAEDDHGIACHFPEADGTVSPWARVEFDPERGRRAE